MFKYNWSRTINPIFHNIPKQNMSSDTATTKIRFGPFEVTSQVSTHMTHMMKHCRRRVKLIKPP